MESIFFVDVIKRRARLARKNDGFGNSDFIHILDPLGNLFWRLGVRVGVHIDDGEFRFGNICNRNFVERLRLVVLEQYGFRRSLLSSFRT